MTNITSLTTGMLSFERSLQISEALMHGVKADGTRSPIIIAEKGVRGQTSSDFKTQKDVDAKGANSNIQTVHAAYVPVGCEALEIDFWLRVMPGSTKPHSCNKIEVANSYKALSALYDERGGYRELAERFVWNLLNGRVAWRNAFQTDDAQVTLTWGDLADETVTVRVLDAINRTSPLKPAQIATIPGVSPSENFGDRLESLADRFAAALAGREKPLNIKVVWKGKMQEGQEVFPSQEYLRDETNDKKNRKEGGLSRVYASVNLNGKPQASIHSQKIGAAIRTIDDWHDRKGDYGVIAVNPYSGVQETGEALRLKGSFFEKRNDVKALIAEGNEKDLHFVMANLVRGGVLGAAKDKAN